MAYDCATVARLALLGVEWFRLRKSPDRVPQFERVLSRSRLIGKAVGRRIGIGAGYVFEWVGLGADLVNEFVEDALIERQREAIEAKKSSSPA